MCVALSLVLRTLIRSPAGFTAVAASVLIIFGLRLSVSANPWHSAATLSGRISREVEQVEALTKAGGALLLDVPAKVRGAYVWSWAVPFALRPPFLRDRLEDRFVLLENQSAFGDTSQWHQQAAIRELAGVESDSWIIQVSGDNSLRRIPVSAEKVRAAAIPFIAGPLKKSPDESWERFIKELTSP